MLRAVDDLLVEKGYAAVTMKGIAERADVGRQTVYRWWSSKAEVLLEASMADAEQELAVPPGSTPRLDLQGFVAAVIEFLTGSDAGLAYRALLGEAQHDPAVAELIARADVLGAAARPVLDRVRAAGALAADLDPDQAVAELVGPVVYRLLTRGDVLGEADLAGFVDRFLAAHG